MPSCSASTVKPFCKIAQGGLGAWDCDFRDRGNEVLLHKDTQHMTTQNTSMQSNLAALVLSACGFGYDLCITALCYARQSIDWQLGASVFTAPLRTCVYLSHPRNFASRLLACQPCCRTVASSGGSAQIQHAAKSSSIALPGQA
jgi:hypothetical protein